MALGGSGGPLRFPMIPMYLQRGMGHRPRSSSVLSFLGPENEVVCFGKMGKGRCWGRSK